MSPTEFQQTEYYRSLQDTMNAGQWPRGCEGCQWSESIGLDSARLNTIANYNDAKILHIHTTSVCDSDCIMCGPRWSTKIAKRLSQYPDTREAYFTQGYASQKIWSSPTAVEHLKQAIVDADRINVVGGEPMLDKKLWQFLGEHKRKDVDLFIVTNGNTEPSPMQLDVMSGFRMSHVTFSIDATGTLYEWIREGMSWSTLLRNVAKTKLIPNSVVVGTAVLQAHNVLNIAELDKTLARFRIPVSYHFLTHPSLLNPANAPKWALEQALNEVEPNGTLHKLLKLALSATSMHNLDELVAHTVYLNQHRRHKFDTDAWKISILD